MLQIERLSIFLGNRSGQKKNHFEKFLSKNLSRTHVRGVSVFLFNKKKVFFLNKITILLQHEIVLVYIKLLYAKNEIKKKVRCRGIHCVCNNETSHLSDQVHPYKMTLG